MPSLLKTESGAQALCPLTLAFVILVWFYDFDVFRFPHTSKVAWHLPAPLSHLTYHLSCLSMLYAIS